MTPAERRAVRVVELLAQCEPYPGNSLDEAFVNTARKVAADLIRERTGASRSGVPLTRSK